MLPALYIGLWAYLYCKPMSQPGAIFYLLKLAASYLPMWLYMPLIGCPKCHAGQVALWWQVWRLWRGDGFDIRVILIAVAVAYALETGHEIVDKYLNK